MFFLLYSIIIISVFLNYYCSDHSNSSNSTMTPMLWWTNPLAQAVDKVRGVSGIDGHEYHSFCRDLKILSAPDFEYCGCIKKDTARRMRTSYQCLIPPP